MLFNTKLITLAAAFSGLLVNASPVPEPQPQQPVPAQNPCSPSFQGVATYIQAYDTYNRIYVTPGSQQGALVFTRSAGISKWRVEGTGSAANDYIIKWITPTKQLILSPWRGSTTSLGQAQGSGNPSWEIKCNSCYPPGTIPSVGTFIGNTCYIIEHQTGLYLTETNGVDGEGELSRLARNGQTNQFFHIVSA